MIETRSSYRRPMKTIESDIAPSSRALLIISLPSQDQPMRMRFHGGLDVSAERERRAWQVAAATALERWESKHSKRASSDDV